MSDKQKRLSFLVVMVCAIVLFVGGGARFAIGLTLKPISEEFLTGRTLIGLAVLTFQIVSAFAMLLAGRLADRNDIRLVFGAGVLIAAAGLGGMAVAQSPAQIVLCYGVVFALGTGIASLIPVGVIVTRAFPNNVGTANALVLTGMGFGQLIVLAAFSGLLADFGWRWVYLVLTVLHVFLLPMIGVGIDRGTARPPVGVIGTAVPAQSTVVHGLDLGEAARTRRFWLLIAIYAVCGLQDFFVSTHIVAFAQDRGSSAILAGNLLALMGLMMLLGVLASGWTSDRTGPAMPTLISFVLRVALFAAVMLDTSILTISVFALLFGFTFLMTAPLCVVFARDAFGTRNLGLFTGLITMIHHIAGGLGAWFGAAWFDAVGNYDVVLFVMLATSIAGGLLTLLLRLER
jgi:MFS family permease